MTCQVKVLGNLGCEGRDKQDYLIHSNQQTFTEPLLMPGTVLGIQDITVNGQTKYFASLWSNQKGLPGAGEVGGSH